MARLTGIQAERAFDKGHADETTLSTSSDNSGILAGPLAAAFLAGTQMQGSYGLMRPVWAALATAPGKPLDTTLSLRPVELFQEALTRVQTEYVEPIDHPEKLVYSAIRGMLTPLNDPYTRFMDPKEFTDFNSDNHGSFAGIGATLNMVEIPAQEVKSGDGTMAPIVCPACGTVITTMKYYRVAIVEPLPDTPALKAGLQAGDLIVKVNGASTDGKTVGEVADQIRGDKGTDVTLTIGRKGFDKPKDFTITRDVIQVPATQEKMLDDHIGYLHILQFNEKTATETQDALEKLKDDGATGLVLDLRNNPGGLLMQCQKVASMFLPNDKDDQLIVSTKPRKGDAEQIDRSGTQIWTKPMVVLVNKGSASASEILSGALKDHKRATIIGEATFGKALVQSVIPLSDGSAMAITTAHYYTPSGYDVGKRGLPPPTKKSSWTKTPRPSARRTIRRWRPSRFLRIKSLKPLPRRNSPGTDPAVRNPRSGPRFLAQFTWCTGTVPRLTHARSCRTARLVFSAHRIHRPGADGRRGARDRGWRGRG